VSVTVFGFVRKKITNAADRAGGGVSSTLGFILSSQLPAWD
jgi:hypothetical protein